MRETELPGSDRPAAFETSGFDRRLAQRLQALRVAEGWSLDDLAERSGISRATLSRIERGETSPSAGLLNRLCAAYQRTISSLLAEIEGVEPILSRHADQSVWHDDETGLTRRVLAPPSPQRRGEVVEITLPAGAAIAYDRPPVDGLEHYIVLLSGTLVVTLDGTAHTLAPGDCLAFCLTGGNRFDAPGDAPARYLLALCRP